MFSLAFNDKLFVTGCTQGCKGTRSVSDFRSGVPFRFNLSVPPFRSFRSDLEFSVPPFRAFRSDLDFAFRVPSKNPVPAFRSQNLSFL